MENESVEVRQIETKMIFIGKDILEVMRGLFAYGIGKDGENFVRYDASDAGSSVSQAER